MSGVISYYLVTSYQSLALLFYVPGVVFGVCVGLVVFVSRRVNILWGIPWILISTASYYAAVYTTLRAIDIGGDGGAAQYVAFLIGGGIGSFLMLVGFHFFLVRLRAQHFFALVAVGGVLGLSWFIGGPLKGLFGGDDASVNLLALLSVWQTIMALGLGFVISRQEQKDMIS